MKSYIKKSFALISVMLFLLSPGFAFAKNISEDNVPSSLARKAAIFHVVSDMKANKQSPWLNKNIMVQQPIEVYDASDTLHSYIFNLSADGKPAGFIEVSADKSQFPILSYAQNGSTMDGAQIEELKHKGDGEIPVREKVVALAQLVSD